MKNFTEESILTSSELYCENNRYKSDEFLFKIIAADLIRVAATLLSAPVHLIFCLRLCVRLLKNLLRI